MEALVAPVAEASPAVPAQPVAQPEALEPQPVPEVAAIPGFQPGHSATWMVIWALLAFLAVDFVLVLAYLAWKAMTGH